MPRRRRAARASEVPRPRRAGLDYPVLRYENRECASASSSSNARSPPRRPRRPRALVRRIRAPPIATSQTVNDALALLLGRLSQRVYGFVPEGPVRGHARALPVVPVSVVSPRPREHELVALRAALEVLTQAPTHGLVPAVPEPVDVRAVQRPQERDERAREDERREGPARAPRPAMVRRALRRRPLRGARGEAVTAVLVPIARRPGSAAARPAPRFIATRGVSGTNGDARDGVSRGFVPI